MKISEVVKSIKQSQQNLQELVEHCIDSWGEFYYLNNDFQTSPVAVVMEKISTDIHYDLQKFNSLTTVKNQ